MSAALEQEMTTTIMPEVTSPTPEKLPLNDIKPAPLVMTQGETPAAKAGESPLLGLILVFPFVFLALIVVMLVERLIKWGIRKFFAPPKASQPVISKTMALS